MSFDPDPVHTRDEFKAALVEAGMRNFEAEMSTSRLFPRFSPEQAVVACKKLRESNKPLTETTLVLELVKRA